LTRMFVQSAGRPAPLAMQAFWVTIGIVAIGHFVGYYAARGPFAWRRWFIATPAPVLGFLAASGVAVAMILTPAATKAFIYFQF
jgi:hypothetical protein